jgi:SanA protein
MRFVRPLPIFVVLLFGVTIFLMVPLFLQLSVQPKIYTSVNDVPIAEVAIVLGASAKKTAPSPVLAARADGAIALYQKGKVKKILVTGDSAAPFYDEVTPVRDYLMEAGIPAQDIFLDRAGFSTYLSMLRAQRIYGAHSATIVTQDFHMPRALFLANHLGIAAGGLVTAEGESPAYEYAREIPASWKALYDLYFGQKSTGDSAALSLEGDGRQTQ